MADKDILEKALENKPKVFADILNAYRFHGKQIIRPEDLTDLPSRSMTPAYGALDLKIKPPSIRIWVFV